MYIKSASALKKIGNTFFYGFLALMLSLLLYERQIVAQETLNLAEPLKKCRVYAENNGLARIIASDNDQNIIIYNDNLSIISLNTNSQSENWKSLSGGRLESETADKENLFMISSFENESRQKMFTLNSVSLKTGVTNWQIRLNQHSGVKLNRIKSEETLYLTIDDALISAVQKNDGKIIWTKGYPTQIGSITKSSSNTEDLYVTTADGRFQVLNKRGEIIKEIRFGNGETTSSLMGDEYILNGYPTGEIIKVSINGRKSDRVWEIKTGARISGLIEYEEELLVTSLDNFIYLYSLENGKLKWKRRVAGRINIMPQIHGSLAIVTNSGDNSTSILDLRDGKLVNQVPLEPETYHTGQPVVSGKYLLLQTSKGIYFFSNISNSCK